MIPRLCFLLLVVISGPFARAEFPAEIVAPEFRLVPGENDAAWRPLLDALAAKGAIAAKFEEHRFFPFKKIPVVLTGEIRLDPARGLSLHYLTPDDRLMIVDAQGVLMRDDKGRQREAPADARAQAATGALLHVMRFNLPELAKSFDLYAARDGARWRFAFEPKPGDLAGALTRVVVTGEVEAVRTIEMRKSALQRVEIHVGETQTGVTFSEAERSRFFR